MKSARTFALLLRRRAVACAVLLALCALPSIAQENPTYTLHVYTNLIQIPVLVRSPQFDHVPKIDPTKLQISIGDGAPFHPSRVRPEGDDPLSLAILLDASDGNNALIPEFSKALVKAASRTLHPADRVAIFVLNCDLQDVALFAPSDPAQLKSAADRAVSGTKRPSSCDNPLHLRDAIDRLIDRFAAEHGRNVIAVVSGGHDTGSRVSAQQLYQLAADAGIAVFGLTASEAKQHEMAAASGSRNSTQSGMSTVIAYQGSIDKNFDLVCKSSGGLAVLVPPDTLASALSDLVAMLRARFIIEFPAPKDTELGTHALLVTLPNSNAYVHPAGISISISDSHKVSDTDVQAQDTPPPTPPQNPLTPQ